MKLTVLHPAVYLIYFFILIIFALLLDDIYYLLIFLIAITLLILLQGAKNKIKETIKFFIPVSLLILILNPLCSHNGTTEIVLFSNFSITLESLVYGLLMALTLFIIYLIFVSFNSYVDYQQLLYLASNHFPNMCMILIMSMRFISLLNYRLNEVKKVNNYKSESKIKKYSHIVAIVISWSLEEAMFTAKSMKARGYGVAKRTNYLKFEFNKIDYLIILITIISSIVIIIGLTQGYGLISIYPTISPKFLQFKVNYYILAFVIMLLPFIFIEINEKILLRRKTWN